MNTMKKVLLLSFILQMFIQGYATEFELRNSVPPGDLKASQVMVKTKQGNIMEVIKTTFDIGIIKIERTSIRCDNDPNRICYYKKGESVSGDGLFCGITLIEYENGHGFGGLIHGDILEVAYPNSTLYIISMLHDTFYEF